jgi:nicotinamidase-related amidase
MELNPRTTAVLAVHLQGDVVTPDGAFGAFFAEQVQSREILRVAKTILDTAREAGATVAYTRVAFQPGYGDLNPNMPLLGMVSQMGCLVDGTEMAEIVPEVAPVDGDLIITHQRVSGFAETDLDAQLRARGVTTVLVIGVATNASVESTARSATDLGYRTVVVGDACSAAAAEAHDATLASMALLGEVASTDEVLQALKSAPAT